MSETAIVALRAAIQRFKAWAEQFPTKQDTGEWECDYERWPEIESAFESCLDAESPQDWTDELVELMLYAIARSNETERLINQLKTRPTQLLALAWAGLHAEDSDARWQLAHAVGKWIPDLQEAEPLLERFFNDAHEYVSRRALIALGDRGSARAEALAIRAWERDDEYQRMAALGVLRSINSAVFGRYLALALQDGREHLVAFATKLVPPAGRG
jgi:HEAT repeat protein